jgi:hypothetical protein
VQLVVIHNKLFHQNIEDKRKEEIQLNKLLMLDLKIKKMTKLIKKLKKKFPKNLLKNS